MARRGDEPQCKHRGFIEIRWSGQSSSDQASSHMTECSFDKGIRVGDREGGVYHKKITIQCQCTNASEYHALNKCIILLLDKWNSIKHIID